MSTSLGLPLTADSEPTNGRIPGDEDSLNHFLEHLVDALEKVVPDEDRCLEAILKREEVGLLTCLEGHELGVGLEGERMMTVRMSILQ